jgi:hypothetical protein
MQLIFYQIYQFQDVSKTSYKNRVNLTTRLTAKVKGQPHAQPSTVIDGPLKVLWRGTAAR